jgi:hypothetical protein
MVDVSKGAWAEPRHPAFGCVGLERRVDVVAVCPAAAHGAAGAQGRALDAPLGGCDNSVTFTNMIDNRVGRLRVAAARGPWGPGRS